MELLWSGYTLPSFSKSLSEYLLKNAISQAWARYIESDSPPGQGYRNEYFYRVSEVVLTQPSLVSIVSFL